MKVEWSRHAEDSAARAAQFIARDKPDAALEWLVAVRESVAALGRFPNMGRVVPEIGLPEFRELVIPPYRLVYQILKGRVVVVAVRHARSSWRDPADDTEST